MSKTTLRKQDYYVKNAPFKEGRSMVIENHYTKGGSNTYVYMHGLYRKSDDRLCGIAWWLPPTRVAAESVNKDEWKKVLALTRLVILPGLPTNSCSFLLGKSIKEIKKEGRFVSLVTYADDARGHTGQIYKATNWTFIGKTGPYPKWIDPTTGRTVAQKATRNRRKVEMEELGYIKVGSFHKFKYIMHL